MCGLRYILRISAVSPVGNLHRFPIQSDLLISMTQGTFRLVQLGDFPHEDTFLLLVFSRKLELPGKLRHHSSVKHNIISRDDKF